VKIVVHDHTRAEMWYHDILNDFSLISDRHCLVKSKRFVGNGEMDEQISCLNHASDRFKNHIDEMMILDQHRKSSGIISNDEYIKSERWKNDIVLHLDNIIVYYRYMQDYNIISDLEYEILYNKIMKFIHTMRKLILERYEFEIEIDRRNGICIPSIKMT
jgi:hypothetical protein